MMMTAEFTRATHAGRRRVLVAPAGWRLNIQADGAVHARYGDYKVARSRRLADASA